MSEESSTWAANIRNASIPLDQVRAHPDNYNLHPASQIQQLGDSYNEFGQYRSAVVWEQPDGTYIQVAGHGFTEAMRGKHARVARFDILPVETPANVVKRILLADNLHARNSEADEDKLLDLLQEQSDLGFDLAALGSSAEELADMLAKVTPDSLDELEEAYGDEPDEQAFWPLVRLKVAPATKDLYDDLMKDADGEEEHEKFASLLARLRQ